MTFFPTPYPGEWWYSVLCRYHIRSGNEKFQSTVRELFHGRTYVSLGILFSNSTIPAIVSQLPAGLLCSERLVQEHTLFRYYTRCFSYARKRELLESVCLGEKVVITSIRKFADVKEWKPRFCPGCVSDDRQRYGEAYWHIGHQIDMMRICPAHRCWLYQAEDINTVHLDYQFVALESYLLREGPYVACGTGDIPPRMLDLAGVLYDYYAIPLEKSATPDYSNLAISLSNQGYGTITSNPRHTILNGKKVYQALRTMFGGDIVEGVYGDEKAIPLINRVCKWGMAVPERYALLQVLAGISSEVVFSKERLRDSLEESLLELRNSRTEVERAKVAAQLGITCSQLSNLCRKYGIEPFWRQRTVGKEERRDVAVNLHLNSQEYGLLQKAAQDHGESELAVYARKVLIAAISQSNEIANTDEDRVTKD